MKRSLGGLVLRSKGIDVCSEISLKFVYNDIKLRDNGTAVPWNESSGRVSFLRALFMD